MVRLPSEYQEVEYLESTGEEWIDTGILPNWHLSFHCKFLVYSNVEPGYGNVFGSRSRSSLNEYQLTAHANGIVSIGTRNIVNRISKNAINVVDFDGENTAVVNGQETQIATSETMNIYTIILFAIRESSNIVQPQSGQIYELSFGDVANFIPCYRKSDSEPGMYDTVTDTFFTNSGTGTFLVGNDVNYSTVNLMESRRKILLNTPHIKSLSGNALSFRTDVPFEMKECKIHFTPKQEGTGTPSPENVRPITGWDGVEVTVCGKNLLNENTCTKNKYIGDNGAVASYGSFQYTDYIHVKEATYTFKGTNTITGNLWIRIHGYDSNGNWVKLITKIVVRNEGDVALMSFSITSDIKYIRISYPISFNNSQLELGSTATAYEPYQATTLTIPFPCTIYGGYVDLVKGEVVEEYERFDIGSLNWSKNKDYLFTVPLGKGAISIPSVIADSYLSKSMVFNTTDDYAIGSVNSSSYNHMLFCRNKDYADLSGFKEANVGKYVVVKHSSPNTYPLTDPPSIPSTLRGLNNLFSNANGEIEIRFYSH